MLVKLTLGIFSLLLINFYFVLKIEVLEYVMKTNKMYFSSPKFWDGDKVRNYFGSKTSSYHFELL